jgi:hypothetical protein
MSPDYSPRADSRKAAHAARRKREAKALNAKAPTMAPRCSCEHPAPHTDLEDHTTCLSWGGMRLVVGGQSWRNLPDGERVA